MTIVLTFDTDYLSEEELGWFIDQYELPRSTFFLWKPFRRFHTSFHEFAPHPFLPDNSDWKIIINRFCDNWGATSTVIRPHSCVYSHQLGVDLFQMGFLGISQNWTTSQQHINPYMHPWGIYELPIYYMDSMDFTIPKNWPNIGHTPFNHSIIQRALIDDKIYIFDFHPIHIILNTSSYSQYAKVKPSILSSGVRSTELRFPGYGTAVFFDNLLQSIRELDCPTLTCGEVLETLSSHDLKARVEYRYE